MKCVLQKNKSTVYLKQLALHSRSWLSWTGGYPSTAAFIRMMEKGILFLARLKSSDYKKEQAALSVPDTWVDIQLDKSRIRHYKGTDIGRRMEELGHITLRMVKVPLSEEREEVLITNLPSEIFD